MKKYMAVFFAILFFVAATSVSSVTANPRVKEPNMPVRTLQGPSNTYCPVDGGKVTSNTSYTTMYGGQRVGFDSARCKTKFLQNPGHYSRNL